MSQLAEERDGLSNKQKKTGKLILDKIAA